MLLAIDQIIPDPNQPRKTFDKEALKELARSFESYGIISPLKVRPYGDNRYMIITGEMRWRASKEKGDKEIEVGTPIAVTDQQAREMQFIENLQRSDIPDEELGGAFAQYCKDYECSHSELARRIGKSHGYISDHIGIVEKLAPSLHKVSATPTQEPLSYRIKHALATIPNHKRQEEVAQPFLNGEVSPLHVEKIARIAREQPGRPVKDIIDDVITGRAQREEAAQLESAKRAADIILGTPEELMRGAEALKKEAERKAKEAMTPEKKAVLEAKKKAEAEAKTLKDEERKHKREEENQKREERAEKKARKRFLESFDKIKEVLDKAPRELIEEKLFTKEERATLKRPRKPTTITDRFYELEKLANKLSQGLVELQEFPSWGKAVLGMALQTLRDRIDETLKQMGIQTIEAESRVKEE